MASIVAVLFVVTGILAGCGTEELDRVRNRIPTVSGAWERVDLPAGAAVRLVRRSSRVGRGLQQQSNDRRRIRSRIERSRRLPRVPLTWREGYSVVGTGEQAIVWGGSGGLRGRAGRELRQDTDTWSRSHPRRSASATVTQRSGPARRCWSGEGRQGMFAAAQRREAAPRTTPRQIAGGGSPTPRYGGASATPPYGPGSRC